MRPSKGGSMKGAPAVFALICYSIGILLRTIVPIPFSFLFFLFCAALLLVPLLVKSAKINYFLCIVLVLAGMLRYSATSSLLPRDSITGYANHGTPVIIWGRVQKAPGRDARSTTLVIKCVGIISKGKKLSVSGNIIVKLYWQEECLQFGDTVAIRGKLRLPRDRRNPGAFDYRAHLQAQHIHAALNCYEKNQIVLLGRPAGFGLSRSLIYPLRRHIARTIDRTLDADQAALLRGLLIGDRNELSPALGDSFSKTGIFHVLAVSGLHVGLVILFTMALLRFLRCGAKLRIVLTVLVICLFMVLTEIRPPVVRASLMGIVYLLGLALQRKTNHYNTLACVAILLLLLNPLEVYQAGFQLSFVAVWSILYLNNRFRIALDAKALRSCGAFARIARYFTQLFMVSLAAQLGTLPLTVFYFGHVPCLSLLVNLLVIPAIGCIVAIGYITVIAAVFFWPLAAALATLNDVLLTYIITTVRLTGQLSFSSFSMWRPELSHLLIYYGSVIILANIQKRIYRRRGVVFLLFISCVLLFENGLRPANTLKITFFDVGQGDAILLQFPGAKTMLVDTGPADDFQDAGKWVIEPYLQREGISKIDALVITHPHRDHYGGAAHLLRHCRVEKLYDSGYHGRPEEPLKYFDVADSLGLHRAPLRCGDILLDFAPALIFVLNPDSTVNQHVHNANDASVVLKVVFGGTQVLLTGDAEQPVEKALLRFGDKLRSDILKLGHHGSNTASSNAFLRAVSPRIAVVSVSAPNQFNLPSASALTRVAESGAHIFRTDHDAALVFISDGVVWRRLLWKGYVLCKLKKM